ncbi:MAG: RsmB/NOP family class I SAM-dependent RNA methyltransferase [Pseudomonadota bacterium]
MSSGLSSRRAAYDVLKQIFIQKQPFDQILSNSQTFSGLEVNDRALTRMMISTVLRQKGTLDILIGKTRDSDISQETIKIILYIGIVQLLFMKIPSHAAINETVELAAKENHSRQKGLVNAILRKIDSQGKDWLSHIDPVQANIPDWLLKPWVEDYGLQKAQNIASASLNEAPLDLTVKDQSRLKKYAEALKADIIMNSGLRLPKTSDITALDGYEEGDWWVQDTASSLPVALLGNDLTGKTVIDLCAAPGGKTAQLAARGAHVIAVDRSTKRLKKLEENLKRLHLSDKVEIVSADGALWQPQEPADIVLLDAPCSATGTLRRHPDIMHLKSRSDIDKLSGLQERLLDNAKTMIKGDGLLIYCTCSLQKKEGENHVQNFLNKNSDFQTVPVKKEKLVGLEKAVTDKNFIRVTPDLLESKGGIDGFFIASLQKSS